MPNHETNHVTIIGKPESISAFIEGGTSITSEVTGPPAFPSETPERIIDFDKIVPQPENIERGGCSGKHADGEICWYDWNVQYWGTKWEAYSHAHFDHRTLKTYEGEIYGRVDLIFDTAWSQPTPIFEAIEDRWGVSVFAITQDEGGFPDVEYGDVYQDEIIERRVTFEFVTYDRAAD